jgi:hypothetical protein
MDTYYLARPKEKVYGHFFYIYIPLCFLFDSVLMPISSRPGTKHHDEPLQSRLWSRYRAALPVEVATYYLVLGAFKAAQKL